MSEQVRITTLVENTVFTVGLRAEHGLALHLQFGPHRVLFDTGQTDLLLPNAQALGLDLRDLDVIVLSHGHYDHCGGLPAVWRQAPRCRLWLHPAAVETKYSVSTRGSGRLVGMSAEAREIAGARARTVWIRGPTEVVPGLFVTGEIPRETGFEDVGGRFFLDAAGQRPDPLLDDQALFFESREGVVVLLGCAHAGVVNTLRHIEAITGRKPWRAVLGGLHLLHASTDRLDATVEALREWDVPLLVPAHCTGWPATARLWTSFPGHCATAGVGSRLIFDR